MTTTIKVSEEVRDRLKQQARTAHRTLGQQLAFLVDVGDRQARFDRLREEIALTSAEDLSSYRDELAEWDAIDRG